MGRKSRGPQAAGKLFTIRVTPAELEELHRRAAEAGLPTSEWARRLLLGPTGKGTPTPPGDPV